MQDTQAGDNPLTSDDNPCLNSKIKGVSVD